MFSGIGVGEILLVFLVILFFFGAKRIDWAFVDITALWFAILVTIISFHRVHKAAAWLMTPYLAWVSFAAVLNGTLWALNR